VYFFYGDTN